jgi:hypothetical protein
MSSLWMLERGVLRTTVSRKASDFWFIKRSCEEIGRSYIWSKNHDCTHKVLR